MSPRGYRVSLDEFAEIAAHQFELLPEPVRDRLDNVTVDVVDRPDALTIASLAEGRGGNLRRNLLGLFVGVPFPRQDYRQPYPGKIMLYQRNIESISRDREELLHNIRETLLHEIGHHVGYSDDQLYAMEAQRTRREGED